MERVQQKYENLTHALLALQNAIKALEFFEKEGKSFYPHLNYQEEYRMHRDSLIQRFEYSEDLFWKYLQIYLKEILAVEDVHGPKPVIRKSFSLHMLSESEAEQSLDMIKDRNLTSHIYVEEIAEFLAKKIPSYYELMQSVAQRLMPIAQG